MNFINDRATRDAVGHTDVIKLARAMLNDKDPAVRKAAAAHLATSTSDVVRAMVRASSVSKSPVGAAGVMHGSRASRGAKATSIVGNAAVGGVGKVARSATTPATSRSRWAHFAGITIEAPASAVKPHAASMSVPMRQAEREAEERRALTRNGGRVPGVETPEQIAAFVAACAAKVRGPASAHHTSSTRQAPSQQAPAARRTEPDLSTPERAAAFVQASAAKARGQTEAARLAANAVALARRAGVIR